MTDMIQSYEAWVERVAAGRPNKELQVSEKATTGKPVPYSAVEFARLDRAKYMAEIGKRDGDYVYHFFPRDSMTPEAFGEIMSDAFLETFRNPDRVEAAWTDEMHSWAVRARGYADNPLADGLALKVFEILDAKLEN